MSTARECFLRIVKENSNGRKIVAIGTFLEIENYLAQNGYGIGVHAVTEGDADSPSVILIDKLCGKNKDYYLVIPTAKPDLSLLNILNEYGFAPVKDYAYLQEMNKTVSGISRYSDTYNNKAVNIPKQLKIIFRGTNSVVKVADDVQIEDNTIIEVGHNSSIEIFSGAYLRGQVVLNNNSVLKIGKKALCRTKYRGVYSDSSVIFGNGVTFTGSGYVVAHYGSQVEIGEDCMFALDATIIAGDGHAVFDVVQKNRTNAFKDKNIIKIGEHVWCGIKSTILTGTTIGSGSIVGACSVVKGNYPNNCLVAGDLATVKKKNICWSRDNNAFSISEIPSEWVKLTEEF